MWKRGYLKVLHEFHRGMACCHGHRVALLENIAASQLATCWSVVKWVNVLRSVDNVVSSYGVQERVSEVRFSTVSLLTKLATYMIAIQFPMYNLLNC